MSGSARPRRRARYAAWSLALALAAGCSSGSTQGGTPRPDPSDLDASVAQPRTLEGTSRLLAGVTNNSTLTVRVTAATITWGGLRFAVARLDGEAVPPGQTAAFTISYAATGCGERAGGDPVLSAEVDGRRTRLPLKQDDPTLFGRLHQATCARQRLDRVATVRVATTGSVRPGGGGFVLPASIVLSRRAGSTQPLRLVDLGGSVLISLTAADTRVPVTLRSEEQEVRVPVTFGSTGRCDAHSLGQSQQTFLLSAYLRLPGDPVQRQVLRLSEQDLAALEEVIDRSCRTAG